MSPPLAFPDDDGMDAPIDRPSPDLGPPPPPRLRRANREQILMRPCSLEELLPKGHDARTIWALVTSWDLSASVMPSAPAARNPAARPPIPGS